MKTHQVWRQSGTKSSWSGSWVGIDVDPLQPILGAEIDLATHTASDPQRLFGLHLDPVPNGIETFCRVDDLITRYQPVPPDEIAVEVYWRPKITAHENDLGCLSLEMIYSLQTDRLDAVPNPVLTSTVAHAEARWFARDKEQAWTEAELSDVNESRVPAARPSCVCICHLSAKHKLLQTAFPADLTGVVFNVATAEAPTKIDWQLRSEFLEKGVIRRMRMLAVIADANLTDQKLLQLADEFYDSELPLAV